MTTTAVRSASHDSRMPVRSPCRRYRFKETAPQYIESAHRAKAKLQTANLNMASAIVPAGPVNGHSVVVSAATVNRASIENVHASRHVIPGLPGAWSTVDVFPQPAVLISFIIRHQYMYKRVSISHVCASSSATDRVTIFSDPLCRATRCK